MKLTVNVILIIAITDWVLLSNSDRATALMTRTVALVALIQLLLAFIFSLFVGINPSLRKKWEIYLIQILVFLISGLLLLFKAASMASV
jgi:uncharacterized membrane protein YczE